MANILGISAYYHESAACLLTSGRLVAAAEEERFSRIKHDKRLPLRAIGYCLRAADLAISDVDCIAYYESPAAKLTRQLAVPGDHEARRRDALRPEREIRELLGYEGRIETFTHHLSHAASAYFFSGFSDAAILTVDGVGEQSTTTYASARGTSIETFEEVRFPHSLGLFYSTITAFLGFEVNDGEYKVMGLAPYGKPRFADSLREVLRSEAGGQYVLEPTFFDFTAGKRMYSDRLSELFGIPPRVRGAEMTEMHHDIARSAQFLLEEILLEKVRWLRTRVPSDNLCMAGGVALNAVANGRIRRESGFRDLFVPPPAGDDGGALGAAALAHHLLGGEPMKERLVHAFYGPSWSGASIAERLEAIGIRALRLSEPELLDAVVDRLLAKKVVAWFSGRMEIGPRALGARSILADPRDPDMRDRLNAMVKKRESFRPFAPSVLLEHASAHFELDHPAPFMLEICQVRSPLALPAITHVDGSARPQTVDREHAPRYHALLQRFYERTGCPMLVNTSFNVADEPIVCSPIDALVSMAESGIDVLAMEDLLIDREAVSDHVRDVLLYQGRLRSAQRSKTAAPSTEVYTFL